MIQAWIEKLRAARSKAERDEILLRSFRDYRKNPSGPGLRDDVEEQLRALASLAFPDAER